MSRILIAGLPPELTSWLSHRLADVSVITTFDGQETLDELASGQCSLLIIGHEISSPAAPDVVERARNGLGMLTLPVVYCLEPGMAGEAPKEMAKRLGISRLLFHPINREELARVAVRALSLHPGPPETVRLDMPRTWFTTLTKIWGQIRGTVMGRLEVLEKATAALQDANLNHELRQEAGSEAHKLGGLLGTFGYSEGTRLAKQIERILETGSPLGHAEALSFSALVVSLRDELEQPLPLTMRAEPDAMIEL